MILTPVAGAGAATSWPAASHCADVVYTADPQIHVPSPMYVFE